MSEPLTIELNPNWDFVHLDEHYEWTIIRNDKRRAVRAIRGACRHIDGFDSTDGHCLTGCGLVNA